MDKSKVPRFYGPPCTLSKTTLHRHSYSSMNSFIWIRQHGP